MKYRFIGLKEALERRDEARKLLANGQDPGEVKKMQKAAKMEEEIASANSFEVVARDWFAIVISSIKRTLATTPPLTSPCGGQSSLRSVAGS